MKRTPLRRKPQADPVTATVHAAVLVRDRGCVLAKLEVGHRCRDQWGNEHDSRELSRMTLEHVKDALRAGKRAESDPAHLVVLCWSANDRVPTKAQRQAFRDYLASVTEPEHPHVELQHGCEACEAIRQRVTA